jgi:hypothetical protein
MAGLLRIPPPWPCTARAWSWLATPDATVTAKATTVAVKGRQANQGGDAVEIESSEFGRDASRVFDSTCPTPGTERSNSSRSARVDRYGSLCRIPVEAGQPLLQPANMLIDAAV